MSHFAAQVIQMPVLEPHPNADALSLARLDEPYKVTVVCRTADWQGVEKAVYIPVDSVVDTTRPEFAFLGDRGRVKAVKLRGVFSMGLLVPAKPEWAVGQDVTEELGVKKYDDTLDNPDKNKNLQVMRAPRGEIKYTDIESLRKYNHKLAVGEQVVVTEKIHGANARFVFQDGQLFAGSHRQWLKEGNNFWWNAAMAAGLPEILANFPDKIFFGEVYGKVQDLTYGVANGVGLRFFDIYDISQGVYLNFADLVYTLDRAWLDMVPILHHGPWPGFEAAAPWAEGNTLAVLGTGGKSSLVREGFVVKPVKERYDDEIGRVILKLHGEGYLCRRGS